jgi:hypothetical protein
MPNAESKGSKERVLQKRLSNHGEINKLHAHLHNVVRCTCDQGETIYNYLSWNLIIQ